jgi:hypothetical protein
VHGDEVVQKKRGRRRLKKKLQRWERPGRKRRDWPTILLDGEVSQMPYAPVRSDRKLDIRSSNPSSGIELYLIYDVKTVSSSHPASYTSLPPPFSSEVKHACICVKISRYSPVQNLDGYTLSLHRGDRRPG